MQNELLRLKMHVIQHHDYAVLRGLMGFDGPEKVARAFAQTYPTLPPDIREFWRSFFTTYPHGILTAGKLEGYITSFFVTLDADTQQKIRQLIRFADVAAQWAFFKAELDREPFRATFIQYFDAANLSKGRDPALFLYAQESGGEAFYNRLRKQVKTTVVGQNFFFRFFFFGPQHLPDAVLPPCYQPQNHALLRERLDRITLADSEAVEYLLSAAGTSVSKASLSNIFEYTSRTEFRRVCHELRSRNQLCFVFWNLLQEQGANRINGWRNKVVAPQPTACFYFKDVRVFTGV